jgi:hypothetical protein
VLNSPGLSEIMIICHGLFLAKQILNWNMQNDVSSFNETYLPIIFFIIFINVLSYKNVRHPQVHRKYT